MAQQFLTSINLNSNELQNALLHPLATAPSVGPAGKVYYNTSENTLYVSDGSVWRSVSGDITSIIEGNGVSVSGTTGDVTLSIDAEASQFSFPSGVLTISTGAIGSDELDSTGVTSGSYGSATAIPTFTVDEDGRLTAAGETAIQTSFSITDGTTTEVVAGGDTLTFNGDSNITLSVSATDTVTVSLNDNVTLAGDLVVGGNFTVNGTVTTVNTETINLADNIITLNSNETGAPTQNAGIEVERGTGDNVQLFWDETAKRWKLNYLAGPDILYTSVIPVEGEYNNYNFFVNGDTGSHPVANGEVLAILGGDGIDTAATTAAGVDTVTITHADTSSYAGSAFSGLTVINGITVDQFGHATGASSADLTADVDARITAREFKASIGDGAATTFELTHNLGTRDVIVQLFDNSTFDTVFADVVRTTTNTVDVSFAVAPALNDIRVLITKIG